MPIPKIKGIETEWSVIIKGRKRYRLPETSCFNQMVDIIRNYVGLPVFSGEDSLREVENIDRVSRSALFTVHRDRILLFPAHHNLLPNGGRLYIDGPHIEYSTPECLSAKTLVAADKAGEAILNLARIGINKELAEYGEEVIIYKDTSDGKGSSYGCHENYLVSREAFNRIMNPAALEVGYLASFFVVRQIFAGAGKMGIESDGERLSESIYQISQRADFIKALLSDCTVAQRGIINTRDEPLADRRRFARLHVIVGDANLAEVANYMKVGITSIILKMIEDGFLEGDIIIDDMVRAIRRVSKDLSCRKLVLETLEGRRLSALDLLEEYSERIQAYLSRVCQPSPEELDLASKLVETISDFRTGNEARLRRRFDWKIKQDILSNFLESYGISWEDVEDAVIQDGRRSVKVAKQLFKKDLLYHQIDKNEGLYWFRKEVGELDEVVSREDIVELIKNPPPECRSYFRGRCLAKFFPEIERADWDEICFWGGQRRSSFRDFSAFFSNSGVEVGNPCWGGKDQVEGILDRSESYGDLLKELNKLEKGDGSNAREREDQD